MFVYDFAHVATPFDEVLDHVLAGDLAALAPDGDAPRLVELQVGRARAQQDGTVSIPIRWAAPRLHGLYPEMQADVSIAPLEGGTYISLRGNYAPPLGKMGAAADRYAMHRLAEVHARGVLRRIVTALVERPTAITGLA
ncbi:MAG TPA: hypothetical protein VM618_10750 [Acidimicrobiia bacterium]|nr:hypothetical protein [Acidimicrobiia bacterium]